MLYNSFKEYIETNYNYLLQDAIHEYINKYHDGQGFHSYNVTSLLEQWPDNVRVMALTCHDESGPFFTMDVHVKADIVSKGLGMSFYQADRKTKWFTVFLRGVLTNGLRNVEIIGASEYCGNTYDESNGLDEYLVPYIRSDQLEDIADDFTKFWCDEESYDGWRTPLKSILENMELTCYEAELPPGEMGRMYFREGEAIVDEFTQAPLGRHQVKKKIPEKTILISRDHFFMSGYGSYNDTVAHEVVHWDKHGKFFEILALLNNDEKALHCEAEPQRAPDNLTGAAKARWWAEWQANALAPRILMPRRIFNEYFPTMLEEQRYFESQVGGKSEGVIMEKALLEMAGVFKVSKYEVKLRAIQLGYKQAEGAFLRVKGHSRPPLSFNPEALDDYQTFILDSRNGSRLYKEDPKFAELIDSGRFVYTGHVVVINNPIYVKKTDDPSYPQGYELTEFALEHVDLCCLRFIRQYTRSDNASEYYDQCYMSKEVDAQNFKEARGIDYSTNEDVLAEEEGLKEYEDEGARLAEILSSLPPTFWGTFDAHMERLKEEKNLTNDEMHFRTGFSERHIRNLRKGDENVSRRTVYALCIGMHLHPYLSDDLVRKGGGYPLTKEGMYCRTLIEKHYMEPLSYINKKLKARGYKPWGKEKEILDVGVDALEN